MAYVLMGCIGFKGFQNASARYRTVHITDLDQCSPNGTVTATWDSSNLCYPVVVDSTGDYSWMYPPGSQYPITSSGLLGAFINVDSDTSAWFQSTCTNPGEDVTKISVELSDPITSDCPDLGSS